MTILATRRLTGDHVANHPSLRVAELRAGSEAAAIPHDVEPLGHKALAAKLGCCPRTARSRLEALTAQQHRPEVLRVVLLWVPTGKGARRLTKHVLWPK